MSRKFKLVIVTFLRIVGIVYAISAGAFIWCYHEDIKLALRMNLFYYVSHVILALLLCLFFISINNYDLDK
jgi:hypothetical protein